jgi:hypothetical protein
LTGIFVPLPFLFRSVVAAGKPFEGLPFNQTAPSDAPYRKFFNADDIFECPDRQAEHGRCGSL